MKKMFLLMVMASASLMAANGGFTESVQQEGGAGLIIIGIFFLFVLMLALFSIPLGFWAGKKFMQNNIENDRDKMAGVKANAAGIAGAVMGLLFVYFFYGTIGSYLKPGMNGEVDFDVGNAYIFSHYVGGLIDKSFGLAG